MLFIRLFVRADDEGLRFVRRDEVGDVKSACNLCGRKELAFGYIIERASESVGEFFGRRDRPLFRFACLQFHKLAFFAFAHALFEQSRKSVCNRRNVFQLCIDISDNFDWEFVEAIDVCDEGGIECTRKGVILKAQITGRTVPAMIASMARRICFGKSGGVGAHARQVGKFCEFAIIQTFAFDVVWDSRLNNHEFKSHCVQAL